MHGTLAISRTTGQPYFSNDLSSLDLEGLDLTANHFIDHDVIGSYPLRQAVKVQDQRAREKYLRAVLSAAWDKVISVLQPAPKAPAVALPPAQKPFDERAAQRADDMLRQHGMDKVIEERASKAGQTTEEARWDLWQTFYNGFER